MGLANEELKSLFSAAGSYEESIQQMRKRVSAILKEFFSRENVCIDLDLISLVERLQNGSSPEHSITSQQYLDLLEEKVVPHSVNMASPRCLGHMTGAIPNFLRPVGELILALNQNMVKVEASKVFTIVERQTIGMLHRLIYHFPPSFYDKHAQDQSTTLGIFASDGTLANITALWIARNARLGPSGDFAGIEEAGVSAALRFYGYSDAKIIASSSVHYSIEKAASVLGLGAKNLIKVPTDHRNRMDVLALREVIKDCVSRRVCVIAIVGIAGTTDCGSIDPLVEIGEITRESNIHFHVDAAWGVPLLFSRSYQDLLKGIAQADSVTADGHKQMYLPTGCSVLLLRHPTVADVIEKESHYILHNGSGDLGRNSLEGSRGGSALFMHAALHVIGTAGYELLVDDSIRKARFMTAIIQNREEFELVAPVETNIVLYRYIPEELRKRQARPTFSDSDNTMINELNERIQKAQSKAGRTFVSRTCLPKTDDAKFPILALRAVIANPLTTEHDIEEVLNDQVRIANILDSGSLASHVAKGRTASGVEHA